MNDGWQTLRFDELAPETLYAILRLRSEIFVVEQECAYLDMDNLDQQSTHMLMWQSGKLCAYQRCLPPGASYLESSIGRIVVDPTLRGKALGYTLVQRGIDFNTTTWPESGIVIHAQAHLEKFYGRLGFVAEGEAHLEDGILHRNMRYVTAPVEK
ncbi:MAG: GNAT family N-acetyltransferase [Halioglobus sp.]